MNHHLSTIHAIISLAAGASRPRDVIRAILEATITITGASHTALHVSPAMLRALTGRSPARAQSPLSDTTTLVTSGSLADKIQHHEGNTTIEIDGHILVVPMKRGGIAIVDADSNAQNNQDTQTTLSILAGIATSALDIATSIADANARADTLEETQRRLREQNSLLRELTVIDSLTQLYNRRFFDRRLNYEIERWRRSNHPLSLVMFDVDHFKTINDTYGHQTGDRVLRHLANVAKKNTREGDVLARHGGEEFVVLMPNSNLSAASKGAERLRLAIENDTLVIDGQPIPVTISAGVAATIPNVTQDSQGLLRAADVALYNAKHLGRNRVEQAKNEGSQ